MFYALRPTRALLALMALVPAFASAQSDPFATTLPSVEFRWTEAQEALRRLFAKVNAKYTIAPDVQGWVKLSLKNVSFETALKETLIQSNAVYHLEKGEWIIERDPLAARGLAQSRIQREIEDAYGPLVRTILAGKEPGESLSPQFHLMANGKPLDLKASRRGLIAQTLAYPKYQVVSAEIAGAGGADLTVDAVVILSRVKGGKTTTVRYVDTWRVGARVDWTLLGRTLATR